MNGEQRNAGRGRRNAARVRSCRDRYTAKSGRSSRMIITSSAEGMPPSKQPASMIRDQIVGDVIHVEHRRDPAIARRDAAGATIARRFSSTSVRDCAEATTRWLAGAERPSASITTQLLMKPDGDRSRSPSRTAAAGPSVTEEIDGGDAGIQVREARVEFGRQADRRRLEVLPRPHLLEAAQFAEPLVLQDRERRKQHADRRDQRHRASGGCPRHPQMVCPGSRIRDPVKNRNVIRFWRSSSSFVRPTAIRS